MAEPKYVPILFKGEMVRAILEGRKTQTRRLVKLATKDSNNFMQLQYECLGNTSNGLSSIWKNIKTGQENLLEHNWRVGDVLYVRETWWDYGCWVNRQDLGIKRFWSSVDCHPRFALDGTPTAAPDGFNGGIWRKMSSLHLPKRHSRIFLEVLDVRVERLQSISPADAIAEGIRSHKGVPGDWPHETYYHYLKNKWGPSPVHSYQTLWEKINGKGSWDRNEWVWVVTFKRLDIPNPWKNSQ